MCLCFGKATAYHHIKVVLKTREYPRELFGEHRTLAAYLYNAADMVECCP